MSENSGRGGTNGQEARATRSLQDEVEENERKARVNAAWEKMNRGVSVKIPKTPANKPTPVGTKPAQKKTPNWMVTLGQNSLCKKPATVNTCSSEEAKRLAAPAALSAVR